MEILNDVLTEIGLDKKEAEVYSTLLENGALTIAQISTKSTQKRTNLYNILVRLEEVGLVKKEVKNKTTKYFPNSPSEIEKLIERKRALIGHAKLNYEILSKSLFRKYALIEDKPLVSVYEGIEGMEKVYEDVNYSTETLLVLRSQYEEENGDVDDTIDKQIVKQAKLGIKARVIGPFEDSKELRKMYLEYDKYRLVEQHFIKNFPFNLPAQIMIYGNKVAMTTIKKEIITTLIDNKEIADTYRTIFEFIWEYSAKEHEEIVKKWTKNDH